MFTARQLSEILGTPAPLGDPNISVTGGVSTDTRSLPPSCLFVALRGPNFDADTFAPQALNSGASIALVHQWKGGEIPANCAVLEVPDTLFSLQKLALWWRKKLEIPIVVITGSNGKTSTKDLTTAVLSQKFSVCATRGNLNNHIGLPLTVLSTTPEHTAAVWEIGMNHAGELAPLCEIARPKLGIITNIGTAHIEFLGTKDAIAEEKATLARFLPSDGTLIVPSSCEYYEFLRHRTKANLISVGEGRGQVRAEELRMEADRSVFDLVIEGVGQIEVSLPIPGRHMVTNALLAATAGWKLGISLEKIAAALSSASLTGGRLHRYSHNGITIIDDTYNANPESMAAAIETLAVTPVPAGANRIIVLGRMGELGPHAPAAHLRVGQLAAEHGLTLIAVGEGAEQIAHGANNAPFFPNFDDASQWLVEKARPGDVVLFKGSRTATVEVVMRSAFPKADVAGASSSMACPLPKH